MNYKFSLFAENELAEAIDYYESRQPGLGERFSDEVHETIKRILYYPDGWTKLDSVFHRCLTKVFPFGVIYSIEGDTVLIASIMNLHRKPEYWKF